jgi:diguanylate cyclase (GGDEF)-like protein/PAS domain S-box-containing protein
VLTIEDSAEDAALLIEELRRGGYDPAYERVETADAMNAALDRQAWDIVLADYRMPHFNGVAALILLRERGLDIPFIFVSGMIGEDAAVAAMKAGANDYIIKGNTKRLLPSVERELRESEIRQNAKHAQEQLRQSEERFRQLAENINQVFFMTNADATSMIYISPAYENIWGLSRQSLYDDPLSWLDSLYPEDRSRVEKLLREDVEHFQAEYRVIRPDGTVRSIWARTFPVRDEKGGVYRLAGTAEDITERKLAVEEAQSSQERIRLLLDSTAEAIYGVDLQGRCTFSNQACLRLLGYTTEADLIGKNMHALVHHTKQDGAPYPLEECKIYEAFFTGQGAHVTDELFWRSDRSPFPAEYWSYPVYKDKVLIGSVVTFLDITERRLAEQNLQRSEERFRQMAENIAEVFWLGNQDLSQILYISAGYEKIWGRTCQSLYENPLSWIEAICPDDRARIETVVGVSLESGYDEEYRIIRPDGSIRWIRDRAFPVKDHTGRLYRVTGIAEDITQRKLAVEALRTSEERFRRYFELGLIGMAVTAPNKSCIEVNDHLCELFGYSRKELLQMTWDDLTHPDDLAVDVAQFNQVLAGENDGYLADKRFVRKDGRIIYTTIAVKCIRRADRSVDFFLALVEDITERKQAEETIQHMAFYDLLTDLPNRNNLIDRLRNAIRADHDAGLPMALMLIDLDRFKEINDTLGYHRGDQLLKEVGARLKNAMSEPDVVAHLGGDLFSVLLPKLAKVDDVNRVIRKIQEVLQPPFAIEGFPIAVEASVGIALYPEHGKTPEELLQRADVARDAAKGSAGGHSFYLPALDRHNPQRLALMGELRQAIEEDQLLLHYQPKIGLKSRKVVGAEALVRWRHPRHGMVPPDQFIGPAEQTGLIHPLTRWVLQAAMRQCGAWRRAGIGIVVSANLSARNLLDSKLPDTVAELLRTSGVTADCVQFEITESAIMADPVHAQETLVKLHEIGIRFSIDDFGIGYSSLSYLQKLPVDQIKVDKSFVIHMTKNKGDAKIVRSTIDLAHNLGLEVVAEGVETIEILDRLEEMNCDIAQGYYFSKPLPAEELTRWLMESPWGLYKK